MSNSHSPSSLSTTPFSLTSKLPTLYGSSVVSSSPPIPSVITMSPESISTTVKKAEQSNKVGSKKKSTHEAYHYMPQIIQTTTSGLIHASSYDHQPRRNAVKFSSSDTDDETKHPVENTLSDDAHVPETMSADTPNEVSIIHPDEEEVKEHENAWNDETDYNEEDSYLEYFKDKRLYELPCAKGLIDTFRDGLKSNILGQLRQMLDKEQSVEFVLEIANSIVLLRLLNGSDPVLDAIGKKASEGAKSFQEGMERIAVGQELLRACLSDISSLG